jgi:hypothetical protein
MLQTHTDPLGHQSAPGDVQVGQRRMRLRPGLVVGYPAVADLAVAEQVLDDVERVLDDGPHLRLAPLEPLVRCLARAFGHGLQLTPLHGDAPVDVLAQPAFGLRVGDLDSPVQPVVAAVTVNLALLAVQQFVRVHHIGLVGRRADHAVD